MRVDGQLLSSISWMDQGERRITNFSMSFAGRRPSESIEYRGRRRDIAIWAYCLRTYVKLMSCTAPF